MTANHRRRGGWVLVVVLAGVLGTSIAAAQETQLGGKIRSGGQVIVTENETVDGDLYASGGQVRIDGTVNGDLIASGGQIDIAGQVAGDALLGSGSVDISGIIDGDARVGSGQTTVGGTVGEDLVVGSGQVTITSSGQVGEDFIFGTGRTTMDGQVGGNVLGGTGRYVRRGTVGGTEDVTIGRDRVTVGDRLLDALQRFVAILVIGALLLWLLPRVVAGSAETLRRRPWASLGVGALGIIGFVVLCVAILVLCILIAIGLGFLQMEDLVGFTIFGTATLITVVVFLFFVAVAFAAQAIVGLFLGRLGTRGGGAGRRWGALALGVLVVAILISLPVVGGWIGFVIALFGLGALLLELWPRRRRAAEPA